MTASADPVAGSAPAVTNAAPAASIEGFEAALMAPPVAPVLHDIVLIYTLPASCNYTLAHVF